MRANCAGFNIGKLDYSWLPQPHDVVAMANAGKEAWTAAVLPRLLRDRYLNSDGSRMVDHDLVPVLDKIYDTIKTFGTNKLD